MAQYTVWSNTTEKKTVKAHGFREAVSKYHAQVGEMPEKWDGVLHVADDTGDERSFRRREVA